MSDEMLNISGQTASTNSSDRGLVRRGGQGVTMSNIPKHRQLPDKENRLFKELLVSVHLESNHSAGHTDLLLYVDAIRVQAVQEGSKSG